MADLFTIADKLEKRSRQLNTSLRAHATAKKFIKDTYLIAAKLRARSTRLLAGVGLTGALLVTPLQVPNSPQNKSAIVSTKQASVTDQLKKLLSPITPHTPTNLEEEQASVIESVIKDTTGITVKATLDGQTLNHQVGFVGYEQHLPRYPGDSFLDHDDEQIAGITPGLGAWGYFAKSKSQFTTQDYLREKWYCVAQTLYLPNWNSDFTYLREWYKYRKVLVVNPANGTSVVCDIADAGPANWTGKQFGASPETMKALNLHKGSRKGLILFLFIDDPDNLVPLGPVTKKL